ncbi:MAG: AAA family ATPase [Cyclobacteriaceae bacterium]
MITRIRIKGFKNLYDVDLELGPFTCIAGVNAVGKSNLFDAFKFLGVLASEKLVDAARSVRSEGQKASELRDIFFKTNNSCSRKIFFEVDLIIPPSGEDDLGERAEASITSVKYVLELKLNSGVDGIDFISIVKEELMPINQQNAKKGIKYKNAPSWRNSVISGRRSASAPFISTPSKKDPIVIRLHQDQQKGKPFDRNPDKMGRTVLSTVSAEFPTAYLVKEEFRSWTQLQLEPTALRMSDDLDFFRSAKISADGSHMPATLYKLKNEQVHRDIYQEVTNRLAELIDDISELWVDKDEKRQLLTLILKTKDGSEIPARSLSDGTLRFLALTLIEADPRSGRILCLEEPENGIHPRKIDDIITLLRDIAFDSFHPFDEENPVRQVIINTHSPLVVQHVPEDSLLIAESEELFDHLNEEVVRQTSFKHLPGTWRDESDATIPVSGIGMVLSYLGEGEGLSRLYDKYSSENQKRVIDRNDVQSVSRQTSLFGE